MLLILLSFFLFFFFNVPATTEIYTLSLHDALPICSEWGQRQNASNPFFLLLRTISQPFLSRRLAPFEAELLQDRKSTRLNSSHSQISYAVFCLKKKKKKKKKTIK